MVEKAVSSDTGGQAIVFSNVRILCFFCHIHIYNGKVNIWVSWVLDS